jgi:hypothetical protein
MPCTSLLSLPATVVAAISPPCRELVGLYRDVIGPPSLALSPPSPPPKPSILA